MQPPASVLVLSCAPVWACPGSLLKTINQSTTPHPPPHFSQLLVLIEEETKKKAQVVKRRYAGPMVRWKSRRVGECEAVSSMQRRLPA